MKAILTNIVHNKIAWTFTVFFFVGFLYLGLKIYSDYGVSYDEEAQMVVGEYFYNAVFHGDKVLNQGGDNYYYFDSSFDMLLHIASLNMVRAKQILTRHLLSFLCFYISVIVFFFLALGLFKDWKLALIGCIFLISHPRIFADSFYNSKDIPFLAFFILATFTLFLFLRKPNWRMGLIHAIVSGYLTSIRLPGIIVPAITAGFLLIQLIGNTSRKEILSRIGIVFFYIISTGVFIFVFIPVFWHNPAEGFFNAISLVKNYPWGGKVLFQGQFYPATAIPWHYLPTWIGITTPIGILVLFMVGLFVIAGSLLKFRGGILREERLEEIYLLLWLFIPILAVILFRSTIYDGWRHMFFIYPALVLIAIKGISGVSTITGVKDRSVRLYTCGLIVICIIALYQPLHFMIKYHPYEYVYFNRLAGKNMEEIKSQYDLDYWGITYLNGLEYVVRSDTADPIFIKTANPAGELNAYLLTRKNRKRIQFTEDIKQADYFITNYRWHPQAYNEYSNEVYSIRVDGASILSVFKVNNAE